MNLLTKNVRLTKDITSRQAANIVYEITPVPCNIWITKENRQINAKSILGLLSLNLRKNDLVTITIDGDSNNFSQIETVIC